MKTYFLLIPCLFLILGPTLVRAEGKSQKSSGPSLMGEIKIEGEDKKRDFYSDGQEEAITYFQNLKQTLQEGKTPAASEVSDLALNHLSGVFLYCTILYGSCTFLLDSLLEVDVIRSKTSGTVSCPTLKKFWTQWVKNGLEERQKYVIPTGYITTVNQFDAIQRPRYLRCEQTVKEELGTEPAGTFFQKRYAEGSGQVKNAGKVADLLDLVKLKVPNVFTQLGSSRIPAAQDWKPGGK